METADREGSIRRPLTNWTDDQLITDATGSLWGTLMFSSRCLTADEMIDSMVRLCEVTGPVLSIRIVFFFEEH